LVLERSRSIHPKQPLNDEPIGEVLCIAAEVGDALKLVVGEYTDASEKTLHVLLSDPGKDLGR
jgi:hypothetical protein